MTIAQNIVIAVVAGIVAAVVALHFAPSKSVIAAGSAAGSTFNTAKSAGIVWAPVSNTASSTSIFNGDASDRIIKQVEISCVGANFTAANSLAQVTFSAATTSVTNQGLQKNGNVALSTTVATSTYEAYVATSSQALVGRRWNTGSYLTFNTNATSTGLTCSIFADYIGT